MVNFKTLTLADRPWVNEIVMRENSPNADYNFANMYVCDSSYRQLIARVGDRVQVKVNDRISYYAVVKAVEKGKDNEDLPISGY